MAQDFDTYRKDTYLLDAVIIPPQSILDGTAPVGVFNEYISSTDLSKLRVCDFVQIMAWSGAMISCLPPEMRDQALRENEGGSKPCQ